MKGNFGSGALIRIQTLQGEDLGVGLTNYKASELKRIKGYKSKDIEKVLGQCVYPEAVHRDNLLLDAAV